MTNILMTMIMLTKEKFFKLFLMCFCASGLIYQVHILIAQYMSGNTIVNIKVGRIYNDTLPGFTICFPRFLSMERVVKIDDKYRGIVNEYLKLMDNYNTTNLARATHLYYEVYNDFINTHSNRMNIDEMMNKISLQYKDIEDNELILIKLFGKVDNYTNQDHFEIERIRQTMSHMHVDPLESLVIEPEINGTVDGIDIKKCFTFFTTKQKYWKNFKLIFEAVTFKLNRTILRRSIPFESLYFSIHSNNFIPHFNYDREFEVLQSNNTQVFKFYQMKLQRLGMGYDTNCFDFSTEGKFSDLSSDLIAKCYQDKIRKLCGLGDNYGMSRYILNEYLFKNKTAFIQLCKDSEKNIIHFEFELECPMNIQPDCNFQYYPIEKKKHDDNLDFILILHSVLPDITITHLPEITFISFVSNFGGLVGMWLGLSLFAVMDQISLVFAKLINNNYLSINVNQKLFIMKD